MREATVRSIPILVFFGLSACGSLTPLGLPPCDTVDPTCTTATDPLGTGTGSGNPNLNPESECSDGLDNDDNGQTDCEDPACLSTCDSDGDGYIAAGRGGDDCDDTKARTYPGAEEICDELDNNCDGEVDEDVDGDGADACEDCDNLDGAIYPGASETCDDGIDSNCDGEDCLLDWADDFETGSLAADWNTGGAVVWAVQGQVFQQGGFAPASGSITHNQISSVSVSIDFSADGSLSFWHRGSTEPTFDKLIIFMDGVQMAFWTGTWGWTHEVYPITAGVHTFAWAYDKDGSVNTNSDKVWIDDVEVVNGAPI